MLNLPPQPGTAGALMLVLGALAGALLLWVLRGRIPGDRAVARVVAGTLALTVAGAPFTLWRVVEDIRANASFTEEHSRYVGAEAKRVDGELAERVGDAIAPDETYYVAVAPNAFFEIRESLGLWLGYALVPRRQVRAVEDADWIVTWGATPARLGLRAGEPRLIGRNRLSEQEPVYIAKAL